MSSQKEKNAQFKKPPVAKRREYRFKPEYRAYVKIAIPETAYDTLTEFTVENVGVLLLDLISGGYQVTVEPTPSGRWSATAYGVATNDAVDDGIGVSAESVRYEGAVAALHYKVMHCADGALWKYLTEDSSGERKAFS